MIQTNWELRNAGSPNQCPVPCLVPVSPAVAEPQSFWRTANERYLLFLITSVVQQELWTRSVCVCPGNYTYSGAYPQGVRGSVPQISGRGEKVPPLFWHDDAIAGFTSQYVYNMRVIQAIIAIKLAPRMHQNLPFWAQKSKMFCGRA